MQYKELISHPFNTYKPSRTLPVRLCLYFGVTLFHFGISLFTLEQVYFPWNDFLTSGTTLFA